MYTKFTKLLDRINKNKTRHFQVVVKGCEIFMASITIKLDENEKAKLVEAAKKLDLSMSQIIRRLIKDYLSELE